VTQPVEQHHKGVALSQAAQVISGFSSYVPEEVTFLVKDVSDSLVEVLRAEYEQAIDQGRHYAEMLPEEEFRRTAEALALFEHALTRSVRRLALTVGITAEKVRRHPRGCTRRGRPTPCTAHATTHTPRGWDGRRGRGQTG
jgi:hypothetical protein